jgi:hypothetical protein
MVVFTDDPFIILRQVSLIEEILVKRLPCMNSSCGVALCYSFATFTPNSWVQKVMVGINGKQ